MRQILDNKKAQGPLIILVVIAIVLAAGWYFLFAGGSGSVDDSGVGGGTPRDNSGSLNSEENLDSGVMRTFVLTGENFKFVMDGVDNPDLKVKQGDIVRIEFTSTQGFHDWSLDEFDAVTAQVRDTDEGTSVEFVADQKGTFEYYCSVGSHRANGMKGRFIVE